MHHTISILLTGCALLLVAFGGILPATAGSAGMVVAWGADGHGQCDIPDTGSDFVAVAGGMWHSLALRTNGSIVAFGDDSFGQCSVPLPNEGYTAVAAGAFHSLALRADGSIACFGDNSSGQCAVPGDNSGFVAVSAGFAGSCALRQDGSVICWGDNSFGQLDVPSPNRNFTALAPGPEADHNIGILGNGTLVIWGIDPAGDYGQGIPPEPNAGFTDAARGWFHTVALRDDGRVACFGWNNEGQCDVPGENGDFVRVRAGAVHSIGLRADGSIACWGGMAGHPPWNDSGYTDIAAGTHHNLAIRAAPRISGIHPDAGERGTAASGAEITGDHFSPGTAITLTRHGKKDIPLLRMAGNATGISGTFDLTGVKAGLWNVTARNPDGQTAVLIGGFTVRRPPRPAKKPISPP